MDFTSYSDLFRNGFVHKLKSIVKNEKMSRNIEKGIYNYTITVSRQHNVVCCWENPIFKNLYLNKLISIYSNLKKDSYIGNKILLKKVKKKEIKGEDLATMSVYDIYPDNWSVLLDQKTKRDKLKYEMKQEAMTDAFKCRKCGSRDCSYYEVQTRSADEPMTQFINCLNCDCRWKQ